MRWFRKTKPAEELCDTRIDPNEFTNLVDSPATKTKLQELRSQMDAWLKRVGDKAAVPEAEMVKQMWHGGNEAPKTAKPELLVSGKTVAIRCATPGASIGYQLTHGGSPVKGWQVYSGEKLTLQSGESLRVVAQRIGYMPSEEVTFSE